MADVVSTAGLGPVFSTQAKETFMGDLDDLLERYLDLVHRYTSLHQTMAKGFASVGWSCPAKKPCPLNLDLGVFVPCPSQFLESQQAPLWPGILRRPDASFDKFVSLGRLC